MTVVAATSRRYHRWPGQLGNTRGTWFAIVRAGFRLANKDSQARFMLWFSLSFVVSNAALFYLLAIVEKSAGSPEAARWYGMLHSILGVDLSGASRIGELRGALWRAVYLVIIKFQLFWVMTTVSRVGPGLISDDIRTRALPIYFARPVTPVTYLLGKWMVVATFIALVTLVPNLLSLLTGVLLTGGLQTQADTLRLGMELTVIGCIIMGVGGLVILALSSLTADRRYVSVGWWSVCLLPWVAQELITEALPQEAAQGLLGCVALHVDIVALSEWIFGLRESFAASALSNPAFENALLSPVPTVYPAGVLAAVVVLSATVCYRRVLYFSRAAANV